MTTELLHCQHVTSTANGLSSALARSGPLAISWTQSLLSCGMARLRGLLGLAPHISHLPTCSVRFFRKEATASIRRFLLLLIRFIAITSCCPLSYVLAALAAVDANASIWLGRVLVVGRIVTAPLGARLTQKGSSESSLRLGLPFVEVPSPKDPRGESLLWFFG